MLAAMAASPVSPPQPARVLVSAVRADHAALLLATVVVVGAALVVVGVAWQSLLPDLVDRALLPSAAVLDGAVYNVARARRPAPGAARARAPGSGRRRSPS